MVVAWVATPAAAAAASRLGALDRPLPGLKEHAAPTPYFGGLAVGAGLVAGLAAAPGPLAATVPPAVLVAASVVLLVGLLDDLRPMGPGLKMVVLAAAAALLVAGGVHLKIRALPDWANLALTFFWVLAATNAMNIVDVMDGLAAGLGAIAALAFAAVALAEGDAAAVLPLALAGASLGFLPWNLRPARIFLGDAGALLVGFLLAASAIEGSYTTWNDVAFLAPVVVLGVPLFDTALVISLRLYDGRSPFRGSNDHVALRIRSRGRSVGATVAILHAVAASLGAAAFAITRLPLEAAFVLYAVVAVAAFFAAIWAARFPMPPPPDDAGGR